MANLLFIERGGGLIQHGAFTDDPLLANAVDNVSVDIERRRG